MFGFFMHRFEEILHADQKSPKKLHEHTHTQNNENKNRPMILKLQISIIQKHKKPLKFFFLVNRNTKEMTKL